ncbi:hypothetical protein MUU53_01670 [Rhizobium lemnae]|uniref:Phage tail assembly protein n=1 Tax=Rhizobium lemnae TaxID=1214924 RepID=A0ABV8E5N8_9HYPH|nr:hypothetical protein [Rhizobium lemnae]MCJ8506614.1 hypothetical protein [Rhizobium lemnae]
MDTPAIKATVLEPQSKDDRSDLKALEITLPPPEMWAELDNATPIAAKSEQAAQATAVQAEKPSRKIERLTFVGAQATREIPLEYPFEHPSTGIVEAITVRRLTVGEVGNLLDNRNPDEPDNFDIYAIMTDIPAPILRGLVDIDGEEVSQVCFDFLPRLFRPQRIEPSSTSPNGET